MSLSRPRFLQNIYLAARQRKRLPLTPLPSGFVDKVDRPTDRHTVAPLSTSTPFAMSEPSAVPEKPKSEKEIAREKAKAEKNAKFAAKQAKVAQAKAQSSNSKPKANKPAAAPALEPYLDTTPAGEKKVIQSFDSPHFSAYNPQAVEATWYNWWEKSGFFKPQFDENGNVLPPGKFVIALPPPNVTGLLHAGHSLANSLQDLLIRWHRMRGFTTLWVPGCDHASLSTQVVVEKMLWRTEGKTRHDLGREAFINRTFEWKQKYHERINNAQRLMGGSMDWSREAFTMDPKLAKATMEAFCTLYDDGLIYRSNRLVNWCTNLNTALSNLEVDSLEISAKTKLSVPGYERKIEFGVLTYFKYRIHGSNETIEVATTRPETILGDTGIAVNPQDTRYTSLVGRYAVHPFIKDRLLKIVQDSYVKMDFGTGAVKLTPAHDQNDYNLGKTHALDFINILNDDGTLNSNAGEFAGQKRFDARYNVIEALKRDGLFVKQEDNAMIIPRCSKTQDVVEPLMKPQWWMKMKDMADAALDVVKKGDLKIAPASAAKNYNHWMSDVHDWCLSRQLWWGHQIPAYQVLFEDATAHDKEEWIVARTPEEAQSNAADKYPGRKLRLERDPDCLDTWFSAGLWPMATLNWPNVDDPDFSKLFPTSLLETGWDILFFWVARMVMFSVKLTGKVPFSEVYCHSLIRDSEGRKMSKSLGNVIDPLDIIKGVSLEALHAKLIEGNLDQKEIAKASQYQKTAFPQGIPECGSDALRFTLISYTTGGGDISFDVKVMHAYRRFCNKIWQASKYVIGKFPEDFSPKPVQPLDLSEKWILHRLNVAVAGVNKALTAREFSLSTQHIYQFFYDEFCDVFIENSKSLLAAGTKEEQASVQNVLYHCLDQSLRLMHPLLPFITEELWQRLPRTIAERNVPSIMLATYPQFSADRDFEQAASDYEIVLSCAKASRALSAEYGVLKDGKIIIHAATKSDHSVIHQQSSSIQALSGKAISQITILLPEDPLPSNCAVAVISSSLTVSLNVAGRISDVGSELSKLEQKTMKMRQVAIKQEELLAKPGFEEQVSETVQIAEKKKLEDAMAAVQNYERTIEQFKGMKVASAIPTTHRD
ncbi:Valine--tRNA ligase, mitochondrial [Venturia effusa]|uniref:valine--tRNA ligase n=1 Tax=Venturia effusa TaxID=50376 RepID=A0A517LRC8_9PEZI|nr:Valine--tRNA ligase, mitochondrial [Venturia effusa]